MSYPNDTSTQINNALTLSDNYSSSTTPNINFNSSSGIYNPSANVIKIFTNNTDALTINASQQLSGNGTGLTNLNYDAISNKPTNFQTDWNTTVSNRPTLFSGNYNDLSGKPSLFSGVYTDLSSKPDLSVYATTSALTTGLSTKENPLLFTAPLTRSVNTISLDLSSYDTIALRNTALSSYLTTATASTTYATITNLNTKENALTFSAPLTRSVNTISLDLSSYDTIALRNTALSSYLTTATASTTYATITNLNTKENALTFSAPLTRTTNTISLDLSSYDTIALRNTALSSYLTSALASTTYATITNLNTKENALTFSAPLTRTTNTISLDLSSYDTIALRNTALSSYLTTATASTTYATITNLNTKENVLTFSAPLTRTTNTISLDLSSYDTIALRNTALSSYLTTATASTTYATITNLNAKENVLTFSAPLTRTTNTISLDLSSYITTANANNLNYRFFNNNGGNHGNLTDFNSPSQFGYNYIMGTANGPGVNGAGQYYSWDIGLGANYGFGTYRAQFALPRNVGSPYLCVRYQENGGFGGWNRISAGYADSANVANSLSGGDKTISGSLTCGVITALVYAINNTGTDYLGVSYNFPDTTTGVYRPIWAMLGSFTGFHRCFTNDELYNDESDETIKDFKFKYAGRVVISSGLIATDDSNNDEDKTWTIHYDKDGITLEDALPIVQLSRQRKDKRVFGVFGLPKRNNSRVERMIINSVGEGGIWVVNTNGNIENGDYLQSSNELGYAEKQDDDLLHNYTVGKSTIDCSFELNSNKYTTVVLGNGVKASFIACSYHCG